MSPLLSTMLNNYVMNNNGTFNNLPIIPTPSFSTLTSPSLFGSVNATTINQVGYNHRTKSTPISDSDGSDFILTTTNSATTDINPHVMQFSRGIDMFFQNENEGKPVNPTTRNASESEFVELGSTDTTPLPESDQATRTNRRQFQRHEGIQIIDWHMLDKWKFYPLSMLSSFTIRCCLYPFTVVKTCIQLQQRNSIYSSMFDAYRKIYASEGMGGLYKGFWVSTFQIISGVGYVSAYEGVRHILKTNSIIDNNNIRALIAGGCASVVGQTFLVPFDVISQHLMVLGQSTGNSTSSNGPTVLNPLNIDYKGRSKFHITRDITVEIYRRDGLRGYYRGYFASLGTYVPNSALWWSFYHIYQGELTKWVPPNTSHLAVQCCAATLGGFTTTILTNPLDVCRARLQVQRLNSFPKTFSILWAEERLAIFTKGLSARLTQSAVFSFAIILGYETIKRFSVKEDYKDEIRW